MCRRQFFKQTLIGRRPANLQDMTYREIFEQAKADGHEWAEAAIIHTDEGLIDETPAFTSDLCYLINSAFIWFESPEGQKYWEGISKSLKDSAHEAQAMARDKRGRLFKRHFS